MRKKHYIFTRIIVFLAILTVLLSGNFQANVLHSKANASTQSEADPGQSNQQQNIPEPSTAPPIVTPPNETPTPTPSESKPSASESATPHPSLSTTPEPTSHPSTTPEPTPHPSESKPNASESPSTTSSPTPTPTKSSSTTPTPTPTPTKSTTPKAKSGMLGTTAYWTDSQGIQYQYDNETNKAIAWSRTRIGGTITIPEEISPGDGFSYPVTEVNANAFKGNSLTGVIFEGNAMQKIDNNAFDTNDITSLSLPQSVNQVDSAAFYNNKIAALDLTNNNPIAFGGYVFSTNRISSFTIPTWMTSIPGYFMCLNALTSITIPSWVTYMGGYAFYTQKNNSNQYSLTSVDLSQATSLPTIREYDFYDNKNLTTLPPFPDSLTEIDEWAFGNCGLTSINSWNNVTLVKWNAFYSNNLTSIPPLDQMRNGFDQTDVFDRNKLTSITIPENWSKITPVAAFQENPIATINWQQTPKITSISERAFRGNNLREVSIPDTVKTIGVRSFANITGSGLPVQYYCNITKVTFGDNTQISSIDGTALEGCGNVDVYMPLSKKASFINGNAFGMGDGSRIHFGSGADEETYVCLSNLWINQSSDGQYQYSVQNLTYGGVTEPVVVIRKYLGTDEEVTIPETLPDNSGVQRKVRYIVNPGFAGNGNVKKVIFPSNMLYLNGSVFYNMGQLNDLELNEGLQSIGNPQVYNCPNFTQVTIPTTVVSMGGSAFLGTNYDNSIHVYLQNPGYVRQLVRQQVLAGNNAGGNFFIHFPNDTIFDQVVNDEAYPGWQQGMCYNVRFVNASGTRTVYRGRANWAYATNTDYRQSDHLLYYINRTTHMAEVASFNGGPSSYDQQVIPSTVVLEGETYTVNGIGSRAFSTPYASMSDQYNGIKKFILPDTLQYINDCAFESQNSLNSIVFPDSLTTIGNSAFSRDGYLYTMNMPANIKTIGQAAFAGAGLGNNSGITPNGFELNFPASLTTLGTRAFGANTENARSNRIWKVSFNSVVNIGADAFRDDYANYSLTDVVIPDGTTVGANAFANNRLEHVEFQGSVKDKTLAGFQGLRKAATNNCVFEVPDADLIEVKNKAVNMRTGDILKANGVSSKAAYGKDVPSDKELHVKVQRKQSVNVVIDEIATYVATTGGIFVSDLNLSTNWYIADSDGSNPEDMGVGAQVFKIPGTLNNGNGFSTDMDDKIAYPVPVLLDPDGNVVETLPALDPITIKIEAVDSPIPVLTGAYKNKDGSVDIVYSGDGSDFNIIPDNQGGGGTGNVENAQIDIKSMADVLLTSGTVGSGGQFVINIPVAAQTTPISVGTKLNVYQTRARESIGYSTGDPLEIAVQETAQVNVSYMLCSAILLPNQCDNQQQFTPQVQQTENSWTNAPNAYTQANYGGLINPKSDFAGFSYAAATLQVDNQTQNVSDLSKLTYLGSVQYLTLYYTANSYSVSYDSNKKDGTTGDISNMPDPIDNILWQDTGIIPDSTNNPTRVGYSFNGWNTKDDGSGKQVSLTDELGKVTGDMNSGLDNIELYANWKPNANNVLVLHLLKNPADDGAVADYKIDTSADRIIPSSDTDSLSKITFDSNNTPTNAGDNFTGFVFNKDHQGNILENQVGGVDYPAYDPTTGAASPYFEYVQSKYNSAVDPTTHISTVLILYYYRNFNVVKYVEVNRPSTADGDNPPPIPAQVNTAYDRQGIAVAPLQSCAGYIFSGWSTTDVTVSSRGDFNMPNKPVTFTGTWTAASVSVTYKYNDDNTTQDKVVQETFNKLIANKPVDPQRPGYSFSAWDFNGSNWNFASQKVRTVGSFTLNAKWTPNTNVHYEIEHYYQTTNYDYVKYDSNAPAGFTATEKFDNGQTGSTVTSTSKKPAGFVDNTTNSQVKEQGTVDVNTAGVGTTILRRYYDRLSYGVTYTYDTSQVKTSSLANIPNAPSGEQSALYGKNYRVQPTGFAKGYQVSAWTATGVTIKGDGTFDMPNQIVEFKAVWTPKSIPVTFDANGGVITGTGNSTVTINNNFDNIITSSLVPQVNRPYFDFKEWNTKPNGQGSTWNLNSTTVTKEDDVDLYAIWDPSSDDNNKVQWTAYEFVQNLDGSYPSTGTLIAGAGGKGVVNTTVNYVAPDKSGFGVDLSKGNNSLVLSESGSNTMNVYYKRNTYQVAYSIVDAPSGAPGAPGSVSAIFGSQVTVAADLSYTGYTFSTWNATGITISGGKFTMPASHVTLNGKYVASDVNYKIETYKQNTDGSTYPAPTTETKQAKTNSVVSVGTSSGGAGFVYDATNANNALSCLVDRQGNSVLKVYYARATYSVTYKQTGLPTTPDDIVLANAVFGSQVTVEPNPANITGWVFSGWTSSDVTPSAGKFTMPNQAVKFTGNWVANTVSVSFYLDDAKANSYAPANAKNTNKKIGDKLNSDFDKPTKAGYTFTGWQVNSTAGANWDLDSDKIPNNQGATLSLVAKFTANTGTAYKVIHSVEQVDPNDNTKTIWVNLYTDNLTGVSDTTVSITAKTIAGHTADSGNPTTININADGSSTATLKYNLDRHDVYTVDTYKGVDTTTKILSDQPYGLSITSPVNPTTKTGYIFSGYSSNEVSVISNKFFMPDSDVTFKGSYSAKVLKFESYINKSFTDTAQYIPAENVNPTVTYDAKLNKAFVDPNSQTVKENPGYTFSGWGLNPAATPSQAIDLDTYTVAQDGGTLKLYAIWTANTNIAYTIEVYEQNTDLSYPATASSKISKTDGQAGASTTITPPTANTGFSYTGDAFINNALTNTISGDGSTVFKVYYMRNTFSVTYTITGTVKPPIDQVNIPLPQDQTSAIYGNKYTYPSDLSASGYTFSGWSVNPNSVTPDVNGEFTMPNQAVAFTASWSKNAVTVKRIETNYLDPTDPSGDAPYGTDFAKDFGDKISNTELDTLPDPTGYKFIGWSLDRTDNDKLWRPDVDTISTTASTLTFYSVWAKGTTSYNIDYYLQDTTNPIQYNKVDDLNELWYGESGALTRTIVPKNIHGFTPDHMENQSGATITGPQTINADGTTQIRLIYKANRFDIKYELTTDVKPAGVVIPSVQQQVYFDTINPVDTSIKPSDYVGYSFVSWHTNDVAVNDEDKIKMPNHQVTFNGEFRPIDVNIEYYRNVSPTESPLLTQYKKYNQDQTEPPTTIAGKKGYTFEAWYTSPTTQTAATRYNFNNKLLSTTTVKLYAGYTPNQDTKYTVVYQGQNYAGSDVELSRKEFTGTTDSSTDALDVIKKSIPGYTLDSSSYSPVNIAADGSTIVTLNYNLNSYNVSYQIDNNPPVDGGTFSYDAPITLTGLPSKTGYIYSAWTSDDVTPNGGVYYMPDKSVLFKTTSSARQITVEFYDNKDATDNTKTRADQSVYYDGKITNPGDLPSRQGYTFSGWQIESRNTALLWNDWDRKVDLNQSTIKLYAYWVPSNIKVDFKNNYSTTDNATYVSSQVHYNTKLSKPTSPQRIGYTFDGWYSDQDCNNAFDFNTPLTPTDSSQTINVFASWKAQLVDYSVYHRIENADGSKTIVQTDTVNGTVGTNVVVTALDPTTDDKVKGHEDGVQSGDSIVQGENTKVYFDYAIKTYQVNFQWDSSQISSDIPAGVVLPPTQNVKFGQNFNLTQYGSYYGYVFSGWQVTQGTPPTSGGSNIWTISDSDVTYTATWTKDVVPVDFLLNYGSTSQHFGPLEDLNKDKTVGDQLTDLADPNDNPTRAGYIFSGWSLYKDSLTPWDFNTDSINKDAIEANSSDGMQLFAIWVKAVSKYTVQHRYETLQDGVYTDDPSDKFEYSAETGTDVSALDNIKPKDGFELDTAIAGTVKSGTIPEDSTLELVLFYSRNVYKVNYQIDGVVPAGVIAPNPQKVSFDSVAQIEQATQVSGYIFSGWQAEGVTVDVLGNFTMPSKAITFTGSYSINTATPYKVESYQENLDGTYTLTNTQEKQGTPGDIVTAETPTILGHDLYKKHPEALLSAKIAGDGSTVLKVYYSKKDIVVYFNYNYGVDEFVKKTVKYSSSIAKDSVKDPVRPGWHFAGWYSTKVGAGNKFNFNTPLLDEGTNDQIQLYAHYDPKTIKVHFYENYGKNKEKSYSAVNGKVFTSIPTAKRDGYKFNGWSLAKTGKNLFDFRKSIESNDDIKLYASWTKTGANAKGSIIVKKPKILAHGNDEIPLAKKVKLSAKVSPKSLLKGKKLKWKSSNTKIASVNQKGVVIGKKLGKVTISVSVGNVRKNIKLRVIKLVKKTYVIVSGDTLIKIAKVYGTTWRELYAFNTYINDSHWIYPGNTLYIWVPVTK